MRKLQLTPEELFPQITPEDREFALKIIAKFNVPIDEICWLIKEIRYEIPNITYEFDDDIKLKSDFQKLFASDTEIEEISITTNKGIIAFKYPDRLFNYFSYAIYRLKMGIEREIKGSDAFYRSVLRDELYNMIMFYFTGTSLGKFQMGVAIGMFLVHFKIYKSKPIMSEQEFEANRKIEAQDYNHYLYDIVKIPLRKFLLGFSI